MIQAISVTEQRAGAKEAVLPQDDTEEAPAQMPARRALLERLRAFAKEHRLILLFAFLLALLIKSPLLAFPYAANDAYRGINLYHYGNLAADEDFYLSRGKEVLEGHGLGNPLIREGKDTYPDYYFTINEYVLVGPFYLLGLADNVDISTLYAIYSFIGVFALIVTIYFFALHLRADRFFATVVAISVVSGYSIIENSFFAPVFNMYGRALHPALSSLAVFSYLILCLRALKTPSLPRLLIAGAMFGALSYIYSYAWTFIAVFNGFLFLLFIFKRDWMSVRHIFLISCLGALISAYNVIRTILYMIFPAGQQFSYFYGAKYGYALAYKKIGPLVLLLFGLFAHRKRDLNWPLIFALLLSGWFCINQQALTGLRIQPNHYLWYYTEPAFIIALSYALWSYLKTDRAKAIACFLVVGIFLTNTAVAQYKAFSGTLPQRLYEQDYRTALDELNKDKNSGVVLASPTEDTEFLVTVYTPHDLFWQRNLAQFNDNPIQRHKDALLLYLYLNKDARREPGAYLKKILEDDGDSSMYKALYQDIEGYASGFNLHEYNRRAAENGEEFRLYRQDFLRKFVVDYEKTTKEKDGFEKLLDAYGVNWILWDRAKQPEWDPAVFRGLTHVATRGNIVLFTLE
ncbi:MAG: hypothetical protein UY03_C0006G0033 [Parcubacteria group bacterium GW2011_GWA2_47_64]|nr:MAG: hypothetical protein UY03_C0006G0033 [Parcubacteria group bacterium GW2011_GWA2_47_64]KKU96538.1 MAG: hypothetical protein UY29_C0010G0043 [Parcubacteria group bacterium GW2011_GWC2_48_17]